MVQKTGLMILSGHYLFRESLASVLARAAQISAVNVADKAVEALEKIDELGPEVVLIDVGLRKEETLKLTKQVTERFPEVKVIILGLKEEEDDILKCIEAGARGYVLKEASLEDLATTIEKVKRGETVCSPEIAYSIFSRLAELSSERGRTERVESMTLTPRELGILQLIANGLSNKEIADQLNLSLHTVKNHVHRILEKLQVQYRSEAVKYAREKRWIKRTGGKS